jgi:hypothetical protein
MKYNFIIPYRNRKEHLTEFVNRFSKYREENNLDAEFYVVHQMNSAKFNRGALNNIGFLEVCKTRPDELFIFHDVDTYPTYWGSIQYDTQLGQIRHPICDRYNAPRNLGTICCFWKNEFERVNGFPNYWGWGIEDNTILLRVTRLGLYVDESNGVDLNDPKRCFNPGHYRSPKNNDSAKINTELYKQELESTDMGNGLSAIEYTVLSSFELAPHFTILNVDFNIKSKS